MVKCLTPKEAHEAILEVMPHFAADFKHFAPVNSQFLADSWRQIMEKHGGLAYGLKVDDKWIGFLLGSVLPDLISGRLQGLEYMWLVKSGYRGQGHGRKLLWAFEDDCVKAGASWVVVGMSSLADPDERTSFYRILGYEPHCKTMLKRF